MRYGRISSLMIALLLCLVQLQIANAQDKRPLVHEAMPPGAIGQLHLMKGRPMAWYYQPIEIIAPQGTQVAFVEGGTFTQETPSPAKAGCLIGQVYRMRLTSIPLHEGRELYPSVEVIDRLHPPVGKEARFPIPIHITPEEINFALNGKFVTRVIYLENPKTALPLRQNPDFQPYFEVAPGEDPVRTADSLGRPIAILRLGSRRPTLEDEGGPFMYQSPPIVFFDEKTDLRPMVVPDTQVNQQPSLNNQIPQMAHPYPRQPHLRYQPVQQIPPGPTAFVPPNMAARPRYAPQQSVPQRR